MASGGASKNRSATVYLHVWTGDAAEARALVAQHYPACPIEMVPHRQMREAGFRGYLRTLRSLRGQALLIYTHSAADLQQKELLSWTGLAHGCRETVFADSTGKLERVRRWHWFWLWPRLLAALVADFWAFFASAFLLIRLRFKARSSTLPNPTGTVRLAYLGVAPLKGLSPGGAMSHMRGVLQGLAQNGASCEVFSSFTIPDVAFPQQKIATHQRYHLFWEASVIAHNFAFASQVQALMKSKAPHVLYQRHGRFLFAGVLLSQRLSAPLVLEYNGSEVWVSRHWDPSRFGWWLQTCERASLAQASLIVTVSNALRDELIASGIPPNRILVNPNAVDTDFFHPGCGGDAIRTQLGIGKEDVLVGFLSTFSYFHGPLVLAQAIQRLLTEYQRSVRLRFLLVGDGLLLPEVKQALAQYVPGGDVIFAGLIDHQKVRSYLDACDILTSPHVRMPDNRPFIGSPTKLFEYMAMGKAIVASRLDQLSEILEHGQTAWLVEPGNTKELADAIHLMASDTPLRSRMGERARAMAIRRHTWKQNGMRILEAVNRSTDGPSRSPESDGAEAGPNAAAFEADPVFTRGGSAAGK